MWKKLKSLLHTLKQKLQQRQVFKVATIYVVATWPLIQVADLAVPVLGLPDSVLTLLLKIFAAGFPICLIFAWLYNFTREGIVRATEQTDEQQKPQANVQTITAVAGAMTVILVVTLGSQLLLEDALVVEQTTAVADATPDVPQVAPVIEDDGKESIAILPFIAFSSDPQDEFFADGMVEELLNLLAKIPDLRVAARTSSFAYKGVTNKTIPQIGRELGVDTILEGSIRKNDTTNKIRVTAQLIKVSSGEHLWSHTYDREYRDVFQIQDEIARNVVQKMQVTLLGNDKVNDKFTPQTTSVEAMVAFGKGQTEMGHRTAESLDLALEHFQQAVQLDKHYARAYAAMADTYNLLRLYGHMEAKKAKSLATEAINNALSLDENLAEAHAAKGLLLRESDEIAAEEALKLAIKLNPNYAPGYMWYGTLRKQRGDMVGAHEMKQKAFELDPKSPVAAYLLATSHYALGNEPKAMELFSHIIANDPYFPGAYNLVGNILLKRGRLDESVQMYKRALDVDALNKDAVTGLLLANTDVGNYDMTEQWFDYASRHDEMFEPTSYNLMRFRYYMARGEKDRAYEFLEQISFAEMGNQRFNDIMVGTKAYMNGHYEQTIKSFEAIRLAERDNAERFLQLEGGRVPLYLAHAYAQLEMSDKLNELLAAIEQYQESRKESQVNNSNYYYAMAMLSALRSQSTEAFHYLQGAIDVGWVQTWQAEYEPVFAALSKDIQFTLMIGGVKTRLATMRENMAQDEAFMLAGAEEI